jgi:hypothetical protein
VHVDGSADHCTGYRDLLALAVHKHMLDMRRRWVTSPEESGKLGSESFSIVLTGEYRIYPDTKDVAAKGSDETPMSDIPGIVRRHFRGSRQFRECFAQPLIRNDQSAGRREQFDKPSFAFFCLAAGRFGFGIADQNHLLALLDRPTDEKLMPAMQWREFTHNEPPTIEDPHPGNTFCREPVAARVSIDRRIRVFTQKAERALTLSCQGWVTISVGNDFSESHLKLCPLSPEGHLALR